MGRDGEGLENANRESNAPPTSNDGPVFLVSATTINVAVQLITFRLQLQFSLQLSSRISRRRVVGIFGFRGELLRVCTWKSTSQFLVFGRSAWATLPISARTEAPILLHELKIDTPVL